MEKRRSDVAFMDVPCSALGLLYAAKPDEQDFKRKEEFWRLLGHGSGNTRPAPLRVKRVYRNLISAPR